MICYIFTGVIIYFVIALFMDWTLDIATYDSSRELAAKSVLWPLTLILYLFLGVIWIFKHAWDTVILGFWDFLKEYPTKIKEL